MEVSGRKPNKHQQKASAEDLTVFCHPCDNDGKRVQARGYCQNCKEYLCDKCYKAHTIPTPCRHHVLLDTAAMPQPTSSMIGKTPTSRSTVTCPNHADKVVELYCLTHNTAVCGVCVFHNHKSCKAEDINDKSKNYKHSQEYTDLQDTFDQLDNNLDFSISNAAANIKDTEESSDKAIENIRKYIGEIRAYLDQKENELLKGTKKMKGEKVGQLKKLQDDCQSIKSDLTKQKTKLTKYENNSNDLYVVAKQAIPFIQYVQKGLDRTTDRNKGSSYNFQPDQTLDNILSSKGPLGKVTETDGPQHVLKQKQAIPFIQDVQKGLDRNTAQNKGSSYNFQPDHALNNILSSKGPLGKVTKTDGPQHVLKQTKKTRSTAHINLANAKMTRLQDIHVKTTEDNNDCWITGTILLSPDRLLAVDHHNKCVKSIDTTTNTVTSRLTLSLSPYDITELPQGQAAVTLRDKQMIQVISTSSPMSTVRTINVKDKCLGISSTVDKLIITCDIPPKVVVMDHYGGVLQTISPTIQGTPLFQSPEFVTVTSEEDDEVIYVSDWSTRTISKLSMEGQVILTYKQDLNGPRGLTVTNQGHILICSKNNSKFQLMSSNGTHIRTVLDIRDGINYPFSVTFCPVQNKLYVSCYNFMADGILRNNIKVFKCE